MDVRHALRVLRYEHPAIGEWMEAIKTAVEYAESNLDDGK